MTVSDDEFVRLFEACGAAETARALGVDIRNVYRRRQRLETSLGRVLLSPSQVGRTAMQDGGRVPPPYIVKGRSTLYDAGGETRLEWVKTTISQDRLEAIRKEAEEAFAATLPKEAPVPFSGVPNDDLLNLFVITDYHIGALAWHEETGADWDIKIAENLLVKWFAHAIAAAPDAGVAIFGQLGDFLHFDGMEALTPASGHLLDVDTRFSLVVRTVIRVLRRVIAMLLVKHRQVYIIMAEGNHDPASSIWLREWLAAFYSDEPRIIVDTSPDPYYCYEHGLTSLFFHHGHKRKPKNIDHVFAAKFRDVFGRTKFSYAHMGHFHHEQTLETDLLIVRQHRTLAAPDAYASRGGWLSGRSADVCTYSKRFGEVQRATISVDMVNDG